MYATVGTGGELAQLELPTISASFHDKSNQIDQMQAFQEFEDADIATFTRTTLQPLLPTWNMIDDSSFFLSCTSSTPSNLHQQPVTPENNQWGSIS